MSEVVLPLRAIGPADRARVGGKGWHLARLVARELPVPGAFVVTTTAFEDALRAAGLGEDARAAQRGDVDATRRVREAVARMAIAPGLAANLVLRARALGGRLAVRSSAVGEDGRSKSFAGQYHTSLHVAPDDVPAAIVRCWASLYAERAAAYRSGGPAPGAMAVVVQAMVDPAVSGVLFTINPVSGSWREMSVEAVWGLGEGLVSGQITPHWYLVRRPRRPPRALERLWTRVRLHVVQRDLPELPQRWEARDDGTVGPGPTPPSLVGRPTLDRTWLLRVCRLGLRVEAQLGEPQDIEWAIDRRGRLWLLQARPITAGGTVRPRRDVLWTRRFIGERWPEPATPLGWSLVSPILEHFIGFPRTQARYLGGGPPLRLVRSRPYLNATAFRHLAFKLPGSPPPRFMLELIPPEEEADWQRRFGVLPDLSVYASFIRETLEERRWERYRWNPFTNPRHWDAFEARLETELPRLAREPASPTDAVRLVGDQLDVVREYVGIHVCSLLFANLWYQVLEGSLSRWMPAESAGWMQRMAVCPPGNRTLETNEALWALAGVATDADLDALEAGDRPAPGSPFGDALAAFLDRYGHRSDASWEVMAPRWGDAPERIVPFLRAIRVGGEAPAERARRQQEAYEVARAELAAHPGAERAAVEGLVDLTRTYLLLRENQRFAFDRLLHALQRTLRWLGARLAAQGVLAEADDIAFLAWEEVQGLVAGSLATEPVREWVARRRAQREADRDVTPPAFLRGDEGVVVTGDGARLQGLGISPGRARGRVRVLRSPADGDRLKPGEILVAHAVDPGWTPLLLQAGGVVLEMGSRLSHGAVVAREYQVPAVVNLDGVTRSLRDGQEVTVDGTRGLVWVHA